MTTCNSCCPLINYIGCNVKKTCNYTFNFVFIDEADNYDITITPGDDKLYVIKYIENSVMETVVGKIYKITDIMHADDDTCSCQKDPGAIMLHVDCSEEYGGDIKYIYAGTIRSINCVITGVTGPSVEEEELPI